MNKPVGLAANVALTPCLKPGGCGNVLLSEVYDALLEAHVSHESARKAAEAVASYDTRFTTLLERLGALEGRLGALEGRLAGLEHRMTGFMWMFGVQIALVLGILWRVLTLK